MADRLRRPAIRLLRLPALAVGFAVCVTAGLAGSGSEPPQYAFDEWAGLVERHEPGTLDEAALEISQWSPRQLSLDVLRPISGRVRDPANLRLLRLGAMLHADIAMLVPDEDLPPATTSRSRVIMSDDGRTQGFGARSVHLQVGQLILDRMPADPTTERFGYLWYRATTAWLARRYRFADLAPHLSAARSRFSDDPAVQFDTGCLYETYASPRIQYVRDAVRSRGMGTAVPSHDASLQLAERYFSRAVSLDPQLVEARIRLGRVIGLQGRHDAAIEQLEQALAVTGDPLLQYYGHLFLGHEREATADTAGARRHFERARDLFPTAQSPHLALSRLARVAGALPGALDALAPILVLPADQVQRPDPWWVYPMGIGRMETALVEDLRRFARAER